METNIKKNNSKYFEKQTITYVILDILTLFISYGLALWLRFDCMYSLIPGKYLSAWLKYIPINIICTLLLLYLFNQYKSIWKFASFSDFIKISSAFLISLLIHVITMQFLIEKMLVTYYILGGFLEYMLLITSRFFFRIYDMLKDRVEMRFSNEFSYKRAMIIGAGEAGKIILDELLRNHDQHIKVCCFIDDNSKLHNKFLDGIPVVGNRYDILNNIEKYHISIIIFAIPTASPIQKRDILNICKDTSCELRTLPGIYQLVNGDVSINDLKEVSVEDLLGRDTIKVDTKQILENISDKIVMVTGGGGSIGSELCRQIAGHNPRQLIIYDIYENNAYDIQQELKMQYPDLNLLVLIGSVRDINKVNKTFFKYKPQLIFHAAAHKHVPLMETSPCEAIKNNVFGTYNIASAACSYECERMVLISTDKAVNPTNIMGASKRLCEMIIQLMDKECVNTSFVAVRFGNVLGSNGSVIPLFKKQIANGGPVTVTHPDIIRYFMTISEAASLVLQAGAYAKGGEIFVLDMGVPVKIDDLARNLIKLSGRTPEVDISITYTGLRPGEKLYEEKLMEEEGLQTTPNKLIHIGKPIPINEFRFKESLEKLKILCDEECDEEIRYFVAKIVETYHYDIQRK